MQTHGTLRMLRPQPALKVPAMAVSPNTSEELLQAARALAPLVRACAASSEADRRLPPELVGAIERASLFRMLVPREIGGLETDVATMVRVIEEVASADGSAGWCVMIAAETGLMAASLPRRAAEEIYGTEPSVASGGVFAPRGQAVRVDGGFRVSGTWPFASGSNHCTWLNVGCMVDGPDGPEMLAPRIPSTRMAYFRAADASIVDSWHVSGLRGTGSNDIVLHDLFVPTDHTIAFGIDKPWASGPLYRFPPFGLLAAGIAGAALGIARGAIDELTKLAAAKTPTGARRPLADRAVTQSQLAEAEALVRSARAFLLETVQDVTALVERGERVDTRRKALLRLASTTATTSATKAVDLVYTLGGATSIYDSSPLQRYFRDIHVATQHLMVAQPTLELVGRVFLGLPTDGAQI